MTIHPIRSSISQHTLCADIAITALHSEYLSITDQQVERSETTMSTEITTTPSFTVAVGSSNPSKIRSVQQALEQIMATATTSTSTTACVPLVLRGYAVESGVADQPYGDEMTRKGAQNRAQAAFEAYTRHHGGVEPHLAVGLEGGLEEIHLHPKDNLANDNDADKESTSQTTSHESTALACMAWMAVYGKRSREVLEWTSRIHPHGEAVIDTYSWGMAKTAAFILPPKIMQLLRDEGMELGDADDFVFSRTKSKHGSGTVGVLTDGLIDRSKYYEHALILALVPWIRHDVYP